MSHERKKFKKKSDPVKEVVCRTLDNLSEPFRLAITYTENKNGKEDLSTQTSDKSIKAEETQTETETVVEQSEEVPEMKSMDDLYTQFLKYKESSCFDLTYDEFRVNLFHAVMEPISAEQLQAELFDLLGDDGLMFIFYLLKNRKKICELIQATGARPKTRSQVSKTESKRSKTQQKSPEPKTENASALDTK